MSAIRRILAALCLWSALVAARSADTTYPLTKLLVADTEAKVAALPASSGGDAPVFVQDVPLLAAADFQAVVQPFLGQPIGVGLVNQLANAIGKYATANDRLVIGIQIPPNPDIPAGVLRLVIITGTYNQLSFQGNKWFSQKMLEERLGIKPGDEVRLSTLEEAVSWINTNPFRHVKVLVNNLPNQPGKADLVIGVQERRPFRAAFSFDDTGNAVIGKRRYTASFQFGNLWGWDHQGSYQFLASDDLDLYQGHALDYRVPLRWRHFLQFSANHVIVKPVFGDGFFAQKGESIVANARYTIPLRTGNEPKELFFGANFKQSNNDLEFVGYGQVLGTKSDVFQAFAGYSVVSRDSHGAWMFAATLNASPGGLNSRNNDETWQKARSGASTRYVYGTLALQRLLNLSYGWDWFSRAVVQKSSANLLATEQLSIGGSNTVRGYEENIYAAEEGFVFSNDLMSPPWRQKLPFLPKNVVPLETRFLGFFDVAKVQYHKRFASDITFAALGSVGIGLRSTLASSFSLSFDYGWQLMHQAQQGGMLKPPPLHSRGHIKAVLAF